MSQYDGLPVLDTAGTVGIDLWGTPPVATSAWDQSTWNQQGKWYGIGWQNVTPQSVNAQITWGADDNAGAISFPAAGSWSVQTYDPNRILDPANTASPYAPFLVPGGMMRITYLGTTVRIGFLDEITFDMASKTGSIRATDGISLMVKAKLPEGLMHNTAVPMTLRAFARWALATAKVPVITVEPNPADGYDPAVGYPIDTSASVWQQINTMAYDCLYAPWLDKDGILRFRYFGTPEATSVIIGGNQPDSIPVDTVKTLLTLTDVYNHIEAIGERLNYEDVYTAKDQAHMDIWGDLLLRRDRHNPFALYWCTQLLQDRGAASVQYEMATIRPQHSSQLLNLLNLGMVSRVNLRVDSHGTPINQNVNVLGGRIEANTESGWSAGLTTYQPAKPWTGEPRKMQVRYASTLTNEIIQSNNGHNSDSAQAQIYVGATGSQRSVLLNFAAIDWSKIGALESARLIFYRPMHDDGDNQPRIAEEGRLRVSRVTAAWDETTNWPGPVISATDNAIYTFASDIPQWVEVDVTGIVLYGWGPSRLAGNNFPQHGLRLEPQNTVSHANSPEHLYISGRRSTDLPYLILKYTPL